MLNQSVIAVDPGNAQSAFVHFHPCNGLADKGKIANQELKTTISRIKPDLLIVEMIASYGMPVGRDIFETCLFIGQLQELMGMDQVQLVYRKDIKIHLCGSTKANDSNIRQALIDRYGAPGTKKAPGFTYGISSDVWSALAVFTYWLDTRPAALHRAG